jgi:hypothetical protein
MKPTNEERIAKLEKQYHKLKKSKIGQFPSEENKQPVIFPKHLPPHAIIKPIQDRK